MQADITASHLVRRGMRSQIDRLRALLQQLSTHLVLHHSQQSFNKANPKEQKKQDRARYSCAAGS